MAESKLQVQETALPACFQIKPTVFKDERGTFVKILCDELFEKVDRRVEFSESFFSQSAPGVFRGLHFQRPPQDHFKLVYCTQGSILDILIDCRAESPTFGRHLRIKLDGLAHEALWIPPGIAHGFVALEKIATVVYHISTSWSATCDTGVLWSSLPALDDLQPIIQSVSNRDSNFSTWESWAEEFKRLAGMWKT
jgi:dTDP-4-dehydrorhamnose 3,5-epimerase